MGLGRPDLGMDAVWQMWLSLGKADVEEAILLAFEVAC